ncbi:hypothetical protein NQ314_000339 [Rhamnusium bicolor]|uniref:Uncharacterized protein n=1 Tax=Rhamnusium bicolor TaxID=1586634 RepID=A0AAV8ZW09_9CUCU|nr:hypothetical protein NQ314_000339 [Rhamnusium bicolor]
MSIRKTLPARQGSSEETTAPAEATVIPSQDSLIGDLLSMDLGSTAPAAPAPISAPTSNVDLLGGGLDVLVLIRYIIINIFNSFIKIYEIHYYHILSLVFSRK